MVCYYPGAKTLLRTSFSCVCVCVCLVPLLTRFEVSMRILYPDPVDFITLMGMANMIWSRLEPSAYMSSITSDPLPNTPTHRVGGHGESMVAHPASLHTWYLNVIDHFMQFTRAMHTRHGVQLFVELLPRQCS